MGNYHPHGDSSIYDTLVRMAQPWSLRYPMIDGQGNFGSPGNDPAAAMRYTECRLTPLAMAMLQDIDENTVDFIPNYDGKTTEPTCCRRGSRTCWSTAAPGSRSGWPPTSRRTTCGRSPPASSGRWTTRTPPTRSCSTRCMERIKGPDFPTGALIVGRDGIEEAYRTGRGSIRMRAVVEIEEDAKGRTILVVTELPYQVNPDNLVESIAELHNDGKLTGIADIADESLRPDRHADRDHAQARRGGQGGAGQPLQAHPAADRVRRQHAVHRRRGAAHAAARPDGPLLRRAPDRGHRPAHPLPAAQGREAGPHPARLRQGAGRARRGHRADPGVGRPSTSPRPA